MANKIKKLTRIKIKSDDIIDTSLQTIDLGQLSNLFIKFCSKFLQDGDIDKVSKVVSLLTQIESLKNEKITYERSFIIRHLERHGLLRNIIEYPMSKEEAEELKQIFGDQIEEVKELMR